MKASSSRLTRRKNGYIHVANVTILSETESDQESILLAAVKLYCCDCFYRDITVKLLSHRLRIIATYRTRGLDPVSPFSTVPGTAPTGRYRDKTPGYRTNAVPDADPQYAAEGKQQLPHQKKFVKHYYYAKNADPTKKADPRSSDQSSLLHLTS